MIEIAAAGALQRVLEVVIQASPTILVGLMVAAIIRHLMGPDRTRWLFSGPYGIGLLKAWLVGMLLPVCSLGVLPVVREMRRARVSAGSTLTFALTAPLFNPISVLYGLTMADPVVLLSFCLGSLLVVTVLGSLWERLMPVAAMSELDAPATGEGETTVVGTVEGIPHGWRRILGMAVLSARESVGPMLGYAAVTLVGVAVATVLLPHGVLQTRAEHDDLFAPAFMALVAVPLYAAPMTVMMQLASMFQHGNSIGAAFSLLVLGAGLNLGLMIWLLRNHPPGRTAICLASLVLLTISVAYAFDRPLYDSGVESAGHTHAFDGYCNPFVEGHIDPWTQIGRNLADAIRPDEIVGGILLAFFILFGAVLAIVDPRGRLEQTLARAPAKSRRSWDVELPEWVLGSVAIVALILASLFGCYLYYPPKQTILAEMRMVHAEVFSAANSGDWDTALYWIPIYDDWSRKLMVSEYLRGNSVSEYRRAKSEVLLEHLERLEHDVEDQRSAACQARVRKLNAAFLRFRRAFE